MCILVSNICICICIWAWVNIDAKKTRNHPVNGGNKLLGRAVWRVIQHMWYEKRTGNTSGDKGGQQGEKQEGGGPTKTTCENDTRNTLTLYANLKRKFCKNLYLSRERKTGERENDWTNSLDWNHISTISKTVIFHNGPQTALWQGRIHVGNDKLTGSVVLRKDRGTMYSHLFLCSHTYLCKPFTLIFLKDLTYVSGYVLQLLQSIEIWVCRLLFQNCQQKIYTGCHEEQMRGVFFIWSHTIGLCCPEEALLHRGWDILLKKV